MATSTLSVSAEFTSTNGVQPTYTAPPVDPTPQTVDNYLAMTLTLPVATDVSLPVANFGQPITQTYIRNPDPANYVLIKLTAALGGFRPYVMLAPGQVLAFTQRYASAYNLDADIGLYVNASDFVLRSVDSTGADSVTDGQAYLYVTR